MAKQTQTVEFFMPKKKGGHFPVSFDGVNAVEMSVAQSLADDYHCTVAQAATVLRCSGSDLRRVLWTIRKHGHGDMPLADVLAMAHTA